MRVKKVPGLEHAIQVPRGVDAAAEGRIKVVFLLNTKHAARQVAGGVGGRLGNTRLRALSYLHLECRCFMWHFYPIAAGYK